MRALQRQPHLAPASRRLGRSRSGGSGRRRSRGCRTSSERKRRSVHTSVSGCMRSSGRAGEAAAQGGARGHEGESLSLSGSESHSPACWPHGAACASVRCAADSSACAHACCRRRPSRASAWRPARRGEGRCRMRRPDVRGPGEERGWEPPAARRSGMAGKNLRMGAKSTRSTARAAIAQTLAQTLAQTQRAGETAAAHAPREVSSPSAKQTNPQNNQEPLVARALARCHALVGKCSWCGGAARLDSRRCARALLQCRRSAAGAAAQHWRAVLVRVFPPP